MSKAVRTTAFTGWTDADLSRLVLQARHAFDTKQFKNCQTYTNILLQADPENAEAHDLQAAIRTEITRDLEKARELLSNPSLEDQPEVFGRGAEIILKRVLQLEPENEEARALSGMLNIAPAAAARTAVPVVATPAPVFEPETFTASPTAPEDRTAAKKSAMRVLPVIAAAAVLVVMTVAIVAFNRPRGATVEPRQAAPIAAAPAPVTALAASPAPTQTVAAVVAPITTVAATPSAAVKPGPPLPASPVVPEPLSVQATKDSEAAPTKPTAPPVVKKPALGSLAVSSRSAAEIYEGDKYLGATPTTLDLSAGAHTLEYRYQNKKTVVTHVITAGQTTTAMVAFEMAIQINAKPWANVSIQGAERKSLGQTPLSDVRVPIGGTLVFENPNFTTKYYRVTGKETAIQVVFP